MDTFEWPGLSNPSQVSGRLIPLRRIRKCRSIRQIYARLLKGCRTENELNHVHICLSYLITPREVEDICGRIPALPHLFPIYAWAMRFRNRHFPSVPFSTQKDWNARMRDWLMRSGKIEAEPYLRYSVAPNITLYSNPAVGSVKSLVICFTDSSHRLLLPIPVFLQHLAASHHDVLMLRDPDRAGYVRGIAGVSKHFLGVAKALDSMIDREAYRSVVTFGTSAGGLPALAMAALLGFDKGVSVGGAGRSDRSTGHLVKFFCETSGARGCSNLLAIFGGNWLLDRQAALSLTDLTLVRTLTVKSKKGLVRHNPIFPILKERKLSSFLSAALDSRINGFSDEFCNHCDTYMIRGSWHGNELYSPSTLERLLDRITQSAMDRIARKTKMHSSRN